MTLPEDTLMVAVPYPDDDREARDLAMGLALAEFWHQVETGRVAVVEQPKTIACRHDGIAGRWEVSAPVVRLP